MITKIKNYTPYKSLNEAVERTIDQKLWASVSSQCSRTYKADLGASAKPIGTADQLLQRYVAGLVILKQQCPMTEEDMENSPAFPQWGKKLVDMGITVDQVKQLWNENCGRLPKVAVGAAAPAAKPAAPVVDNTPEEEDEDDLGFALGMSEDEYQADKAAKREAARLAAEAAEKQRNAQVTNFNTEPDFSVEDNEEGTALKARPTNVDDQGFKEVDKGFTGGVKIRTSSADEMENPGIITPNTKQDIQSLGKFTRNVNALQKALHKGTIRSNKFPDLNGCQSSEDSMKALTLNNLAKEGITDCENLDDFKELMAETGVCYAMRVFAGGDPEEVKGDVVWADAPTETSYYVAAGSGKVGIYYKDVNGDFTCAYIDTMANFGFTE